MSTTNIRWAVFSNNACLTDDAERRRPDGQQYSLLQKMVKLASLRSCWREEQRQN